MLFRSSAYYEVGAKDKARQLFKDVAVKYQENLTYYSELTLENQIKNGQEIVTDLERYRALIIVLVEYDEDFAEKEFLTFTEFQRPFERLFPDDRPDIREESDINRDSSAISIEPIEVETED